MQESGDKAAAPPAPALLTLPVLCSPLAPGSSPFGEQHHSLLAMQRAGLVWPVQ